MEAKELMLFDLVKRKKDGKIMTVVELRYAETIAAITPDDVYYGDMEDYHESEIEPIPLTPEILEKNGWISDNSNDHLRIYNLRYGKEYSTIAISDDGKWSIEVGAEIAKKDKRGRADLVTFIRDWCDGFCVHELQHCLKLVGIEKDIVL